MLLKHKGFTLWRCFHWRWDWAQTRRLFSVVDAVLAEDLAGR